MVAREPKNEQPLCEAVIRILAHRRSERIIRAEPIDAVVRNRPAVEFVYETPSMRFAVEHTRIESFPNQIAEGKRVVQLRRPLSFLDPGALSQYDEEDSDEEERWVTLGTDRGARLLVVCHTYREVNKLSATVRIFSARKATPQERADYERQNL